MPFGAQLAYQVVGVLVQAGGVIKGLGPNTLQTATYYCIVREVVIRCEQPQDVTVEQNRLDEHPHHNID